ncbi:MAG TPA: GTPase Era, partial [Chloroflexi bacterium]|nr:GTPase Era [Chloroflexota bacterium]
PEGPLYYDREQITDFYEREIAADLIRQACLEELRDEIPHGIAVRIDEYKERNDDQTYIHATIIVNRESHKGIVIGKGGLMLKQIGTLARKEIEEMTDGKVFLELRVKTNKNWRNNPDILQYLGFALGR